MARCACNVAPQALGLTSCYFVPAQIKKLIFTTSNNPRVFTNPSPIGNGYGMVVFAADTTANPWDIETPAYTPPASAFAGLDFLYYFPYSYSLQTEIADDAVSEREDPVTQTIGGIPFFVRRGNRSLNLTWVGRAAELVHFYELLRCQKELYVFLVDVNGVVWGKRIRGTLQNEVAPLRVLSATINSKLNIPTIDTVESVTLSLLLDRDEADGDIVPVASDENLVQRGFPSTLGYRNLIALKGYYEVTPGNDVDVRVFYEIHASPIQNAIPVTGLIANAAGPVMRDATGTLLATASAEIAPGVYRFAAPVPAAWAYIDLLYSASVWSTTTTGYHILDMYGFRVNR